MFARTDECGSDLLALESCSSYCADSQYSHCIAGIWTPGGVSTDGSYAYVSTGNTAGAPYWQEGNAVLRLTYAPKFRNLTTDYFRPANWKQYDNQVRLAWPAKLCFVVLLSASCRQMAHAGTMQGTEAHGGAPC